MKWTTFKGLEWAAELRAPRDATPAGAAAPAAAQSALWLWVFVSTIGELNAIEPFLRRLLAEMGDPPLLLITDHDHYRDSYQAKFPDAAFAMSKGRSWEVEALAARHPARMLLIAEIPCILSDAPCRFSFAAIYELKKRRVPVCLVNGWLYHYDPPCRLDDIEKRLFHREYVRLIDLFMVQTEAIRGRIVAEGADPARVHVTGNIKFDATRVDGWSPARAKSPQLIAALIDSPRPRIVAGCVTEYEDQARVLDAFLEARRAAPDALLVLAPRHPEYEERMTRLRGLLESKGLRFAFRTGVSRLDPALLDVLVLDTMGELRDFYAAATVAYVGPDHNVLEPLAFGKPVFVTPGWEETYPSYPVYRMLLDAGGITQVPDFATLGTRWGASLADPAAFAAERRHIEEVLSQARGATERCLTHLRQSGFIG